MKVTVEISDDLIFDMIVTAIEQGIGYWTDSVEFFDRLGQPTRYRDQPISELGHITVRELDSTATHTMRMPKPGIQNEAIKALDIMAEKYPHHFVNVVGDNHDAETADVFVQCWLFKEIKYS